MNISRGCSTRSNGWGWAAPGLSCSMAQGWLAVKSHDQPEFPEASHSSWHSHLCLTQVRYFICFVSRHSALLKSLTPLHHMWVHKHCLSYKICFIFPWLNCNKGEVPSAVIPQFPKLLGGADWGPLFLIYWSLISPKTDLTNPAC